MKKLIKKVALVVAAIPTTAVFLGAPAQNTNTNLVFLAQLTALGIVVLLIKVRYDNYPEHEEAEKHTMNK